jgi:hypothetical protein
MSRPFFFTITLISLLSTLSVRAQSINFNYISNSSLSYNLNDVRKLTFNSDTVNLYLWDGSIYSWHMNTIRNFDYDYVSTNTVELVQNVNKLELTLFPNPTNHLLNIVHNLSTDDNLIFSLYNIQGKLMIEKIINNKTTGKNQETIDISGLANGNYIFQVKSKTSSISKKIIKQ